MAGRDEIASLRTAGRDKSRPYKWRAACGLTLVLCCGFAVCAAEQKTPVDIPLQNPGFEQGKTGWSQASFARFHGLITIDRQTSREGNVSLKISSPRGNENPWLPQSVKGLRGGATYTFRAWVKGDGESVPSLAALKIEFYNVMGENTSGHYARKQPVLSGEWEQIEVRAKADPDTTRAALLVRLFGRGTVWFDDLEFVMVEAPPAISLSPERQAVAAGEGRSISLVAHLAEAWEKEELPPLSFVVIAPGDSARLQPACEIKRYDSRTFVASLKMSTMVTGGYRVECTMEGVEQAAVARVFVPVEKRKPNNLTDNGVIVADGEPFFPIGLYHVGQGDYAKVAKRGFNCVQGAATRDLTVFGKSLDAALNAGLKVDVPLYADGKVTDNLPVSLRKIERYRKHLAVLNWKIIDEPDLRHDIIDEAPGAYERLRAADPEHPLLLTVASPSGYEYWASFCDILQVDPYPLPSQPLTMVSDFVSRARKALKPWQNLTAVLQAGWRTDPLNQPSFAQARVMLYLALVNGAKGVFWYSYRDPGWRLSETPLWERFEDINKETASLARPIMLGAAPEGLKVEADGEGLQWMARELGGKTYVLLVNPGDKALKVTIAPGREVGSAPCLHGKAAEVEEGNVRLELGAVGADTVILRPKAGSGASED